MIIPVQSNAQIAYTHEVCADLSIRYTVFNILAREFEKEEEFKSYAYEGLLNSSADKETIDVLKRLIKVAWNTKKDDVVGTANLLYSICVNQKTM